MTASNSGKVLPSSLETQWQRRRDLRHEMRLLRQESDETILKKARAVPGFKQLENLYSVYVDRCNPDTLQLSFGNRSMFRATADGKKTASEAGPTLLYTQGPTGEILIILYPAKSDLARTHEDHLFLQRGATSGIKLIEGMERDFRVLVAYAHVSSIDMAPGWGDQLRIWLLRQLCARGQNGEFKDAPGWSAFLGLAGFGARTFATASFLSMLKPFGLALLLILLGWLNWDTVTELVRSTSSPS